MKKWALIAIAVLFLAACGDVEVESYEVEIYEEESQEEISYEEISQKVESQEESFGIQHFLDDLDYILHVLETNFALFDVAYWARGADISAIGENARQTILDDPYMDVDGFYNVFLQHFAPLLNIGHLNIIDPAAHLRFHNNPRIYPHSVLTEAASARLRYPHVMAFYEPRHHIAANTAIEEIVAHQLGFMTERQIQMFFVDRAVLYGEEQLAEDLARALADSNYDEAVGLIIAIMRAINNTPNVVTEIIEEGRIARLAVSSFMLHEQWPYFEQQIFGFYDEIRDFDHLIIDMRRNTGGDMQFFYNKIMAPNIAETHTGEGFAFLKMGDYAAEHTTNLYRREFTWRVGIRSDDRQVSPIAQMLEEFDLPEFRQEDTERLEYGFRTVTIVRARPMARFDNQPAFGGKIWMLTGEMMGSSAQISAWLSKDTGFATLVGDITGGVCGGPLTMVALPNTGILFQMDVFYVTDRYGRPLEAGTVPHYFNREGMDALETVLSIINYQ